MTTEVFPPASRTAAWTRVLWVTGRESESRLAFAGLHQLLRPVLSIISSLPGRQAQALLGALGLAADPGAADPLLTGMAVLTLLSDPSERSPVLVVTDDAQWLDRSSLEALAFAASRLDAERVVLLVGARGQAPPPGLDRGFPELHLGPLSGAEAGLLLDGQPQPPRGRARVQVLAQAGGNPMALIELARVIADDPAASRRWAAEPLPLTDRLTAVLTSRFAALPEPARAALLLAAVADGPDLSAADNRGSVADVQALAPTERLGLVKIDRTGLRFSHPLVRSAIYHSALRAACRRAPRARERAARPARPAGLAPGGSGPATRRAGGCAAGGHRSPGATPRRCGRCGAGPGTRGRAQPRTRGPGPQADGRRVGRCLHRSARTGSRNWPPGPWRPRRTPYCR